MPIVATIRDAAKGLASLFVTPGQLGRGSYILQLRVALEGEVQTVVSEPLNVLPSIKVTQ
ncbi:MAG: hypothetical protein JXR75_13590 [Rhodobacteraceae bacterium]|nr:hypothetical protein [Paracoccaceae bacterium]